MQYASYFEYDLKFSKAFDLENFEDPLSTKKPRGRPPTAPTFVALPPLDDQSMNSSEMRYVRTRMLNNAASKRHRLKMKIDHQQMEVEEMQLQQTNVLLKSKLERIQNKVEKFKAICSKYNLL